MTHARLTVFIPQRTTNTSEFSDTAASAEVKYKTT
jgi:hypothetical protein